MAKRAFCVIRGESHGLVKNFFDDRRRKLIGGAVAVGSHVRWYAVFRRQCNEIKRAVVIGRAQFFRASCMASSICFWACKDCSSMVFRMDGVMALPSALP